MNKRKKILLVNHSPDKFGGANDDYLRLLKHLRKFRDRFYVVGMFPEGKAAEEYTRYCEETKTYTSGFFPVTSSSVLEYAGIFRVYFRQRKEVKKFLRDGEFDLVVINVVVLLWIIKWSAKYSADLIFIREKILPDSIRKIYYKIISRYGNYFIAVSKSLEADFRNVTGKGNIETINSAIENDELYLKYESDWQTFIIRNRLTFLNNKDEKVFFCLGTLCDRKNQLLVLQAATLLLDGGMKEIPHFVFIGDDTEGSYRCSMESYIAHHKLEGICHILGPLPREMFYNQFPKLKGVIISSKSEGLPLVVSEAMRFGAPLITTNAGGIGDVVMDGENGLIIENDPRSLSVAITRLCESPELEVRLRNNGKETFSREFDLERNLQSFTGIIDKVINQAATGFV